MYKKYIASFFLLAVLTLGVTKAKAVTLDDLYIEISSLQAQVSRLSNQLAALTYSSLSGTTDALKSVSTTTTGTLASKIPTFTYPTSYGVVSGACHYFNDTTTPPTDMGVATWYTATNCPTKVASTSTISADLLKSATTTTTTINAGTIVGPLSAGFNTSIVSPSQTPATLWPTTDTSGGCGNPDGTTAPCPIGTGTSGSGSIANTGTTTNPAPIWGISGTEGPQPCDIVSSTDGSEYVFPPCELARANAPTLTHTLLYGESSIQVKKYQRWLIDHGYLAFDGGTGYFGRMTVAATKAFQALRGIDGDGTIVGRRTQAAIANSENNPYYASTTGSCPYFKTYYRNGGVWYTTITYGPCGGALANSGVNEILPNIWTISTSNGNCFLVHWGELDNGTFIRISSRQIACALLAPGGNSGLNITITAIESSLETSTKWTPNDTNAVYFRFLKLGFITEADLKNPIQLTSMRSAINMFQKNNNLPQTGLIDSATQQLLNKTSLTMSNAFADDPNKVGAQIQGYLFQ